MNHAAEVVQHLLKFFASQNPSPLQEKLRFQLAVAADVGQLCRGTNTMKTKIFGFTAR